MKRFVALSLAAYASAAPAFSTETIHGDAAPILSSANAEEVPGAYIIKFKDHVDEKAAADHHSWVKSIHDTWVKTFPEGKDERILELRKRGLGLSLADDVFRGLKHTYKIGNGFVGYAGHFDDSVIEQVRRHPDVEYIHRDTVVHTMKYEEVEVTKSGCAPETEKGAPWGLARVSHRKPLNFGTFNKYLYADEGGEGVDAYVIDTGTNTAHVDFGGRAHWGKTIPQGDEDVDGNGHGTHCSGTVAGSKYGVAKKANIYAVKVLKSNGSGTMSDVIAGVEFAAQRHLEQVAAAKKGKRKGFKGSVANMSLGGGKTTPLDAAAATPAAPPFVQHVRIKSRRRWRNAAIGAGVIYMCWSAYFTRVIVPPLAERLEDDEAAPLFFPLPFTFRVVESRPYKGSDPEWQEYIRISKDRALLLHMQKEIAVLVRHAAEANPILVRRCGREMKVRKYWLDFDFPYRPPPKILRNGLMLSADGLAYVTTEVDSVTMMRVMRALWPEPVALSMTSFVSTLFRLNVQNVARYFGFETAETGFPPPGFSASNPARPQDMSALASKLKRRLQEAEADDDGRAPSGKRPAGAVDAGTLSPASPASPAPSSASGFASAKDLIPFPVFVDSINAAWLAFRKKLGETWQPLRPAPPSGSVGVSGLVELQSPHARIMIEAQAFWDPKTRKYDTQTMHFKLRRVRPHTQGPLRDD